jgi:hypothetical protein
MKLELGRRYIKGFRVYDPACEHDSISKLTNSNGSLIWFGIGKDFHLHDGFWEKASFVRFSTMSFFSSAHEVEVQGPYGVCDRGGVGAAVPSRMSGIGGTVAGRCSWVSPGCQG